MLGLSPWIALAAFALAVLAVRLLPSVNATGIERALNSRWAPLVAGLASGVVSWWLWGSLSRTPVIHDESAYLLQAQLFAHLRWTGAAPPIPEFFEQLHVLVDGALASKYPPGNSLVLTLGVLLGVPGLPVVLLNASAGALMYVLARRISGGVVALFTWVVWQSSFPDIYYHANYMSESVTGLTWLMTWWGILRWRDGDGRRWLVVAAAAVAWCMITRPVTGLALGMVAMSVVSWRCRRTRAWPDLVPAVSAAAFILAIIPLWSWRTTGDPRVMPLTYYTKTYVPFDKPGFASGADDRPSARLPRDLLRIQYAFYQEHLRHTIANLPKIAWARITMLDRDAFYEWRGGLRLFALLGLLALSVEGWIALVAFIAQFVLYLSYAHPAWWTMYYVECTPVLAFITALGMTRVLASVYRAKPVGSVALPRSLTRTVAAMRMALASPAATDGRRLATAALVIAAVGLVATGAVTRQVKVTLGQDHSFYDAFAQLVRQIPEKQAIVFVRYTDKHPDGLSLVRNVPDLDQAPVWTVYDRGEDNARLMALAPDRAPYLFDEKSWSLKPLNEPRRQELSRSRAPTADSLRVLQAGQRRR
ncbi:MAG TPA: glycosyltransferase family 39 protein [Gemmatimonadaceae bacterium]|jgi:hypothetical protein